MLNGHEAKFKSITRSLLYAVITTSTIITTVLTMVQITLEYKTKLAELDTVISSIEASLIPALEDRLWNLNLEGLSSQLHPIIQSVDASSIKLINEDGSVLYEESLPDYKPEFAIVKSFAISATRYTKFSKYLGKLEIVFFRDKIIKEVRDRFFIVLLLNGLKTALVASVLLIIFNRKIAKPILEITRYFMTHKDLSKVSGSDFEVSDREQVNDELSVMTKHIKIRELKLSEWAKSQEKKMRAAENALADADETIRQEKIRAESSARLAQLGEMATSIAHEINNPLAIISGYNHIIHKETEKTAPDLDKIRKNTNLVNNTTERITKIIAGLRAYARDGAQDPMELAAIHNIIEDTVAMTETKLRTKGVQFKLKLDVDRHTRINCRSVQIVQTLVAIMNNAVDAISEMDDRWIELSARRVDKNIELGITDSGHGIAPEIEAKIFDPFFTTKQVGHGTGLGLSISYGIIKDHGGQIFVDYKCPNTKFVIELTEGAYEVDTIPDSQVQKAS